MMVKTFYLLLVLSVSLSFGQGINIAVLDLDPTGISDTESQFLSDRLRSELFETGVFQVVERQKMNSILKEQGFQNTGCTTLECAVEIGQLLNVKQMVAGSIGKIEDIYSISLRLIDVRTGAIQKTATRDYDGRLSAVLTDVIPEIADQLSANVSGTDQNPSEKKSDESNKGRIIDITQKNNIGLFLKGGVAILNYTDKLNTDVDRIGNISGLDVGETPQHSNFGFELHYTLSERWALKAGMTQMGMTSNWIPGLANYDPSNSAEVDVIGEFERSYTFVNTYFGANYDLWRTGDNSTFYIGMDIGGINLKSEIKQRFELVDGSENEIRNDYSYTIFALKITGGFEFQLAPNFALAAEMVVQTMQPFDTSEELADDLFPEQLSSIVFPEEVSAAGIQLNLSLGYYF